jgi:hypothetical protein
MPEWNSGNNSTKGRKEKMETNCAKVCAVYVRWYNEILKHSIS